MGVKTAAKGSYGPEKVTVPYDTINLWLTYWKKNDGYFRPKKRGRKEILSETEKKELHEAFNKIQTAACPRPGKDGFPLGASVIALSLPFAVPPLRGTFLPVSFV